MFNSTCVHSYVDSILRVKIYEGQWRNRLSVNSIEDLYLYGLQYYYNKQWYEIIRDYLFVMFCYKILAKLYFNIKVYGIFGYFKREIQTYSRRTVSWILGSRFLKSSVDKEVKKALNGLENDIIRTDNRLLDFPELPRDGLSDLEITQELDKLQEILPHTAWEDGKVSGAVYHGGENLILLQSEAFQKYCVANQLHPDVFPAVRKMEAEVVAMTLKLFHAPEDTGCGTTTSGGTESLLLACLSAKMLGLKKHGITKPEMIVPVTAHAGFDKAAYYFGIKIHHVDLDPITFQVDLKKMEKFINKNTVLLAGSVPNFPHGINDNIEGIGKLAERYHIPLHVDCCLGSFIVAFMEKAGFKNVPIFDFRIPGVTSISCDTHKYGFAPKGSSIIMYRNEEIRKHQYYIDSNWVGGLYGSATLAGSRPGALVVGCWATMISIGEAGYIQSCKDIVTAARRFRNFIDINIPALQVIGNPIFSVVAFTSNKLDVYELSDRLSKRGWHLSALQKPAALHIAVTKLSLNSIDSLCHDLSEIVDEMMQDPDAKPSSEGTSAVYGVAGSIKTSGIADRLIVGFLDALFKLKPNNQ